MIPETLKGFMNSLVSHTSNGSIKWSQGAEDTYFCNHNGYELYLVYRFDIDEELGMFKFYINKNNQNAFFSVHQYEYDYRIMQNLYESASISAAKFTDISDDFFR